MKKLIATAALGLSLLVASPAFAYEVQSGDTMGEIAKENNISLQKLSKANPQIKNVNLIYVGQEINTAEGKVVASTSKPTKSVTTKQVDYTNESSKVLSMKATAYTAYCHGCSGVTATGIDLRSNPGAKVIAVDPNVIPLGTKVYVEGYGNAIAGDKGGAIKGNRIDIFIPNKSAALDFGTKTVKVHIY